MLKILEWNVKQSEKYPNVCKKEGRVYNPFTGWLIGRELAYMACKEAHLGLPISLGATDRNFIRIYGGWVVNKKDNKCVTYLPITGLNTPWKQYDINILYICIKIQRWWYKYNSKPNIKELLRNQQHIITLLQKENPIVKIEKIFQLYNHEGIEKMSSLSGIPISILFELLLTRINYGNIDVVDLYHAVDDDQQERLLQEGYVEED